MGHDEDRAADDGDNAGPEGMMAQEMNHGKCQLLYSKAAEKHLGYPEGWRYLWHLVFFSVFPLPMRQAFIAYLEASFIVMTNSIARVPKQFDYIFAEPKWVFKWHLTEESEHCWDSVPDMLENCGWGWRFAIWLTNWGLMPLLMFPMAFLEGILYGWRSILKNPLSLPCSFIFLICFQMCFLFMAQTCVGMHILLGMRPSDKKYHDIKDGMHEVFAELKPSFKVTHIQDGQHSLVKQEGHRFKAAGDAIIMAERFNFNNTFKSPKANVPLTKKENIKKLANYRHKLYNKTMQDLADAGFTDDEIKASAFGMVQERLSTGSYAPPEE